MRVTEEEVQRRKAKWRQRGRRVAGIVLLSLIAAQGSVMTRASAQTAAAGSTDSSEVGDIILSRQMLMIDMQRLMEPIDAATTGAAGDSEQLKSAASSIAAMMNATAHLFPAESNLYDPSAEIPQTSALPALWEDFATFTAMARASVDAAIELSLAEESSIRQHAEQLRASCDACHGLFLLPYQPPSVSDEDLEFDLDGLFDDFE